MSSKNKEEMAALKAEVEGQYMYIFLVVFSLLDACWHHVHLCVCVCVCVCVCTRRLCRCIHAWLGLVCIFILPIPTYMITEIKDKITEMIRENYVLILHKLAICRYILN